MNARPILILLTSRDDRPPAGVETLCACARAIAALDPAPIRAVVAGRHPGDAAEEAARRSGVAVTALEIAASRDPCDGAAVAALTAFVRSEDPAWILVDDTTFGRHLAPVLAAGLSAAFVAAVEDVDRGADGIVLTRTVYGGKFRAAVRSASRATVLTVAAGAFAGRPVQPVEEAAVRQVRSDATGEGRGHLEWIQAHEADSGLARARAIVAAGNGIGEARRLDQIQALADRIAGARVAGSRPVCDRGWLPYSRQVGITGTTVSPALYIACGISGAAQHLAGMSGAGLVVAINKDPRAAFFHHADIAVVEDLTTFVPLLIEACGRRGGPGKET